MHLFIRLFTIRYQQNEFKLSVELLLQPNHCLGWNTRGNRDFSNYFVATTYIQGVGEQQSWKLPELFQLYSCSLKLSAIWHSVSKFSWAELIIFSTLLREQDKYMKWRTDLTSGSECLTQYKILSISPVIIIIWFLFCWALFSFCWGFFVFLQCIWHTFWEVNKDLVKSRNLHKMLSFVPHECWGILIQGEEYLCSPEISSFKLNFVPSSLS